MKVVYQTCCGVDVHKSFLVATIIKTTSGIEPLYPKKYFSTFNNSILQFKKWLLENECRDACIESTGKYWVPVFNLLEDDINVTIANPKWVKAVKGNKDDAKDSRLFRSLKKSDSAIESIEGYQMTDSPKYRIPLVRVHLDYITSTINDIDTMLNSLITSYKNAVQLLCTIPGVGRNSAITVISEIGTDMTPFSNSKRLCCWAGLTPSNNESAGKKKSVRITRAGVYLKPALVQVAHAAVKSDKSLCYKKKYERIMKRRGKKRAIITIARMLLTAIYHILSTGEVWNPTDLFKVDMPEPLKEKQKEKAIKQAKKLLISEGIISESQLVS
jgi:transposase